MGSYYIFCSYPNRLTQNYPSVVDKRCMVKNTDIIRRTDELESRLEAKKADLRDLATMGTVITSILEIDKVLSVVMEMAIRLVDGEVGMIILEENNELKTKITWGVNEDIVETLVYLDGEDISSNCFRTKETITLNGLGIKNKKGFLIESILCAPIKTANTCHGIIMIINKSFGELFTEEDKETLEMFLNFVAVAIDNSKLVKDKLKRQKMEQEMAIAKQIQETILPANIDSFEQAEIGVAYYPAREVGGDFYDIVRINESEVIVIIGDVSNKGVPAALVMSAAAGIIRSILNNQPDIAVNELAGQLNNLLVKDIIKDREMFVTLFFCKFNFKQGVLTFCNAGHLPGLFWDEKEKCIRELAEGGPIVGQFPDTEFKQGESKLSSGDRLFLFTDGLTEAVDAKNNMFGRERVEQVFLKGIDFCPKKFCVNVKKWVDEFTSGSDQEKQDDFTILQVKVG